MPKAPKPRTPVKSKQPASKEQSQPRASSKRKRQGGDDPSSTAHPAKATKVTPPRVKEERRDCIICCENKPLSLSLTSRSSFPQVPSCCEHEREVCRECYKTHFQLIIQDNLELGWKGKLTCPSCDVAVPSDEAKDMLPKALVADLDRKIARTQLLASPNYRWCPNPRCGHGQLHKKPPAQLPRVQCSKCKGWICFNHQRKWHQNWTCEEFDSTTDVAKALKKNEQEISRVTKPCPICKTRIMKQGGCNHMRCSRCGGHWFWDQVTFNRESTPASAEIRGGPPGAPPLTAQARADVEQVMQFENARAIDQLRAQRGQNAAPNQPQPQDQPRRRFGLWELFFPTAPRAAPAGQGPVNPAPINGNGIGNNGNGHAERDSRAPTHMHANAEGVTLDFMQDDSSFDESGSDSGADDFLARLEPTRSTNTATELLDEVVSDSESDDSVIFVRSSRRTIDLTGDSS